MYVNSGVNASPMFWISSAPPPDTLFFFSRVGQIPIAWLVLPLPLACRLARLFTTLPGAEFLMEGGFWICREPLVTAGADFAEMLLLHPALFTARYRLSP